MRNAESQYACCVVCTEPGLWASFGSLWLSIGQREGHRPDIELSRDHIGNQVRAEFSEQPYFFRDQFPTTADWITRFSHLRKDGFLLFYGRTENLQLWKFACLDANRGRPGSSTMQLVLKILVQDRQEHEFPAAFS